MADEHDAAEKTEDPTQKRLDDAHDRGDVTARHHVARGKDRVAVVESGDHQMMAVGCKQQGYA